MYQLLKIFLIIAIISFIVIYALIMDKKEKQENFKSRFLNTWWSDNKTQKKAIEKISDKKENELYDRGSRPSILK